MERERRENEQLDESVEEMRADVNEMEARSEELGGRIEKTRSDWHAKQEDAGVPGAQPPPGDANESPESEADSENVSTEDANESPESDEGSETLSTDDAPARDADADDD
jgi:hypothetical protein